MSTEVVEAAAGAFEEWSNTPPAARRELLNKAAGILRERSEDIAGIVTDETNGTFGWGMFNVNLAAGMLEEAAALTTSVTGEVIPSNVPGLTAMGVRQPAGVVLGIAPWNAPVILGTRAVATPLACGNTVILKASEVCPRTHGEIVRAIQDAGAPEGVINLVTHEPEDAAEVVNELIAHPAVRRVNFTGSTRVGRLIAEQAARHLKRVLLELGGKAPMVVLPDADLDEAVAAAKFGAFMHQGQICMSTERVVVDRSVLDPFAVEAGRAGGGAEGGRPARPRDPDRPDGQRRVCAARGGDGRGRGVSRRRGGDRRRARRRAVPAHRAQGRDLGDAPVRRGVLRPGGRRAERRRTPTTPCAWPTTPSTAWPRRCSAPTCPPRWPWPAGSRAASAT